MGNIQKMSDDEINVRVNNALATASKGVLNNFKNNWSKIDDYLTDEKFSVVSGLLKDFVPVVASEKYVIVASDLISMVDRINDYIIDVEMFFLENYLILTFLLLQLLLIVGKMKKINMLVILKMVSNIMLKN